MTKSTRITKLKECILANGIPEKLKAELKQNTGTDDFFTVFLSVCNKKERARVFHGSGKTLHVAWGNAEKRLEEYQRKQIAHKKPFVATWVKADIVNHFEEIKTVDLNKIVIKNRWHYFTRIGISLDSGFNRAFIEAEVNGNKILNYDYSQDDLNKGQVDYDAVLINLENLNHYLKKYYGMPPVAEIPENITIFTTRCFFCGEDNVIHELYSDNMDFGRRRIDLVDDKVINEVITGASEYLVGLIDDNGKFTYGYFPIFGAKMTNYNTVRHTSTLWSILNLYRMSGDEKLIPKLEKAIGFLSDYIELKDEETAYLVEKDVNEIKLGGNGVAIIMYTEYMDVFKTDKYVDIVKKLANGILALQNPETGKYFHVLNYPDYSQKEEHRIVYYDGEATFALSRAYSFTKEQKYLDGAKAAIEYFIRENYIIHRDHWVAYSLLEVTKYDDNVSFYEFALRNVEENLKGVYYRETSFHTYLELLMTGWQTYQRALRDGIDSDYIRDFDPTYFAQTIYHRARHMLNGYFYPEYAMYMKFPETIMGAFHVRHHNYRVRIDDVQHFIGGYYFYCIYYDEIRPYLSDEFISGQDNSEALLDQSAP